MTKNTFILALPWLVHFQAAWILPLGGNVRFYDLAILLIIAFSIQDRSFFKLNMPSLMLFVFFIFIPLIAILTGSLGRAMDVYGGEQNLMGGSFLKSEPVISYIIATMFCLVSYSSFSLVKISGEQKNKFAHRYVLSTTLVSIYSLYAAFFVGHFGLPDLVPNFLDQRNFDPSYSGNFLRTVGFSNEPGTFALLVITSLLTLTITPISKKYLHAGVQILTLALTFSAPAFLCIVIFLLFYVIKTLSYRNILVFLPLVICLSYLVFLEITSNPLLNYLFVKRPFDFVNAIFGNATTDFSGGQRAAAAIYGIAVSKFSYLQGVGPGLSPFYFSEVINDISSKSSILKPGIFALDIYSHTLSEFGILGLILITSFIVSFIVSAIRTKDFVWYNLGLVLIFLIFGLAISPVYAPVLFFPFCLRRM